MGQKFWASPDFVSFRPPVVAGCFCYQSRREKVREIESAVSTVSRDSPRTHSCMMGDFPCWRFPLRDSLALQHKEKIILSLCGSVCPHVCLSASGSERVWLSGLTESVSEYKAARLYVWLCFAPEPGRGSHEVRLQLALRCIHTYPLQFSSYCEAEKLQLF